MFDGQLTSDGDWLYPQLWDGCLLAVLPAFGPTGLTVYDWINNSIGTINGATAPNAWTQSNGQWAYKSNATSDYIDFGTLLASSVPTKAASLSAWIYKPSSTATASVGFGQNINHQFLLSMVSGVTYFQGDSGPTQCYPYVTDTRTRWNYYVMSYSGGAMTAWINGVPQTLTLGGSAIAAQIAATGSFTIGRQQSGTRFNSSGVFSDDVMLLNRPMAIDEVLVRYANGFGRGIAYTPSDQLSYARLLNRRRRLLAAGII